MKCALTTAAIILGAFMLCSAASLQAADIVIVTQKDGKTKVIGEIASADGEKIVVKPEGADSVELKWENVQKVSNGLTQQAAAKRWKEQNADKICPTCHGDKVVACQKCGGTGKDPATKAPCKTCNATGEVKCTVKSCVGGKCDCPNSCLN
jgi:hypothetical protein